MYLTETKLKNILTTIKPKIEFIHDKIVQNSNIKSRPDFRSDVLKLIIEFDGYNHYTSSDRIYLDEKKDIVYKNMGYTVFRIPYFIQMNSTLLKMIFNEDIEYTQEYPNGFIDKKAILPADFCEMGINKFEKDLERFDYCKNDIIESLKNKIIEKEAIELVVPSRLKHLVDI